MAPWWLRAGNDDISDNEPSQAKASYEAPLSEPEPETTEAAPKESAATVEANLAKTREANPPKNPVPEPEATDDAAGSTPPKKRRRRRRRKPARSVPATEPSPTPAAAETTVDATAAPQAERTSDFEPTLGVDIGPRGLVYSLSERGQSINDERKLAMFCDFENIALGVRDSEIAKLQISLILARLLEKGKIIVKKAYADWERYSEYKKPFHEAAIELIDIPRKYYSGKNSADIKMVVDAMDLCYSKEHLDTFVLVSGDSDFSPLVSKLKENNKYVIGVGVKNSSSNLLIDNCDEFIYYEDIWRDVQRAARLDNLSTKDAEVFGLLLDAMFALTRENKGVLWGSMIKQTMQRKRPSFNEGYYGYSTFSELLEDGERKKVIRLERDQRSGNYAVTGFTHAR